MPVLTHLAHAQLETRDAVGAVVTYRDARVLNPESEFLAFNLARALDQSGQVEEAKLVYRQVLDIDSRSARAWLNLAELAETNAEKQSILREAVNADSDSIVVFTQLAELVHAAGNFDEAQSLLAQACRLTPEVPGLWLLRGQVAERQGQPLDARAHYQRALFLNPEEPAVMLHLAKIHLQLQDFEDARLLLHRVVRREPNGASGRAAHILLDQLSEGLTRE